MTAFQDIHLTDSDYTILEVNTSLPPSTLNTITSGITHVHADCILTDFTLATFLPPLSHSQIQKWWYSRIAEVESKTRIIWIILAPISSRTTSSSEDKPALASQRHFNNTPIPVPYPTIQITGKECEVAGVVSLSLPPSQTGPFRAMVEKLFVSPLHRRRGFARIMMTTLEDKAWELGRWHLLLETEVGSAAENVYPRLGYRRGHVLERYGYSPKDGREIDEVTFWKDLRWERGEMVNHHNGYKNPPVKIQV